MTLADLLKDSADKLTQFKPAHIAALEASITEKVSGKAAAPYVQCLVRAKPIKLTPEEAVRQLYVRVLTDELAYPVNRMELEYGVTFGREKKRADICIFDKDKPKWNDDAKLGPLCPRVDDYPIFFATMREPSKDNSGDKIYHQSTDGAPLLDEHGHLIVKHDLFSHELQGGQRTSDGIAEAFIEFAKKENLGFFP